MHTDRETTEPTISGLLRETADELRDTSPSARLDCELILGHVLRKTRVQLCSGGDEQVSRENTAIYVNLVRKRQAGEPVAHLVGTREFWSMELAVTANTLIPRPETEILVDCALTHLPKDKATNVLDLGTGSGAVALALAQERPHTSITATDISDEALRVARYNAHSLDLIQIEFLRGDWFVPVAGRKFSTIIANPPYVSEMELVVHDFELQHEPRLALAGGDDGLESIRKIIEGAPKHLFPGGWLAIEHGHRQGPAVEILMREAGLRSIFGYTDLQDHVRVTEGNLPA